MPMNIKSHLHMLAAISISVLFAIFPTHAKSKGKTGENGGGINYSYTFSGNCSLKMLNRDKFLPCDDIVSFVNLKKHRSFFRVTAEDSTVLLIFEGGVDRQPDPEHYYLTVDKVAIAAKDTRSIDEDIEGECSMHMNAEATKIYQIKCDAYDRKAGLAFDFVLSDIKLVGQR